MRCHTLGRWVVLALAALAASTCRTTDDGSAFVLHLGRKQTCPNWKPALDMAREHATCDANNHGNPSSACQQALTCDICEFLNETNLPIAFVDLTGNSGSTSNDFSETHFKEAYCTGDDNVSELGSTMVHEAFHLCAKAKGLAPDMYGRRDKDTDECRAQHAERACGFNPRNKGEGCFF